MEEGNKNPGGWCRKPTSVSPCPFGTSAPPWAEDRGGPGTFCTKDLAEKVKGPGGHSNALCLCRKLTHATSETKSLQRSLQQTQERKAQLEDEIIAYEERMKKLNVELKKLQGFHQQSELEVRGWGLRLSSS